MALFGGERDVSFIHKVNKELINDIVQQEVDYFKPYLPGMKSKDVPNLYGEASANKTYYKPVRIACLILQDPRTTLQDEQFGPDVTQIVFFQFLRVSLVDVGLVPFRGDIIQHRKNYYEVHNLEENRFIMGKDEQYPKSVGKEWGDSLSIICGATLSRLNRLQIEKVRP